MGGIDIDIGIGIGQRLWPGRLNGRYDGGMRKSTRCVAACNTG